MAQTKAGAEKTAAKKLGMTVAALRRKRAAGFSWCRLCRSWHGSPMFGSDSTRWNGLASACRKAKAADQRARHVSTARPKPPNGRSFVPARDGDKKQARRRVNYFVEAGIMPRPSSLPCSLCGDEDRHREYHHHNGYGAAHHEDVVPLCRRCHRS